ncbi:MAG TPA: type II toxin-antitoxin system RelE/ParE family toxin [Candidatus Sulfomarinibacteraceae bacterium]|nr:type II toxin-antitoxin system RelE/ParE family toxin [Candidatus Sulfomarinibacteraceae bacterium]
MTFRVTPSARAELLEVVARLGRSGPERAARFVAEVEDRLGALERGTEDAPELASPWRSAGAGEGHRLYVRERTDGLWLIAVWPEPEVRSGF